MIVLDRELKNFKLMKNLTLKRIWHFLTRYIFSLTSHSFKIIKFILFSITNNYLSTILKLQRLVFEEIDHGNSNQPDVVRLVDCNTRNRNATPVQDYSYVGQSGK